MNTGALIRRGIVYVLLCIAAFISVFPFYWMVVGSTNKSADVVTGKPTPGFELFNNIASFFATVDVVRVFWNSTFIAVLGTVLTLAGGLPRYAPDLTEGNPWAIELGTGARCIAITGTVTSVGNIDLTYSCDDGSSAGLTVDTDGVMRAHYGQPDGPLQQTGVVVAWRGRSYRFAG